MNCEQYRDLLNQHLDGDPTADDGLGDHARQCPDCAALFRGAQRLSLAFNRMKPPPTPRYLAGYVLAALRDEKRRRLSLRLRMVASGMAAAVLIIVLIPSYLPRSKPAEVAVVQPLQPAPEETTVTLRDTVNQAGQAVGQLTARTADETVGQTKSIWATVTPLPPDDWDKAVPIEPSSRPLKETGQSAVVAIEPVTNSARRAFGMLFHDLRPMDKPAKPEF